MSDDRGQPVEGEVAEVLQGQPLRDELAAMLRLVDPVPPDVVAAARAAFAWRRPDADVAALVGDVHDEDALAGVRSGGGPRELAFRAGGVDVLVEVASAGRRATLTGQVAPPAAGAVVAEWVGGSLSAPLDDRGRFVLDGVPGGAVRLRVDTPGRPPVVTGWVRV